MVQEGIAEATMHSFTGIDVTEVIAKLSELIVREDIQNYQILDITSKYIQENGFFSIRIYVLKEVSISEFEQSNKVSNSLYINLWDSNNDPFKELFSSSFPAKR